jgi:hypothetical protein
MAGKGGCVTSAAIITSQQNPPIPSRRFDWAAVQEGYDEGDAVGYGPTEQAAIACLMGQLGATCEEVANELAKRGFSNAQISKLMNELLEAV